MHITYMHVEKVFQRLACFFRHGVLSPDVLFDFHLRKCLFKELVVACLMTFTIEIGFRLTYAAGSH